MPVHICVYVCLCVRWFIKIVICLHNNFFYVERTLYSPKGSVIAPPLVSIWRSSILFVVGEQNFCFQKLEIYLLFLKPWHFLFPKGKWKSILDGVHWIWVCGWVNGSVCGWWSKGLSNFLKFGYSNKQVVLIPNMRQKIIHGH